MKRAIWVVGDYSIRPAGDPDKCFYCGALKGQPHNDGCVIRNRTIVVRSTMEYVIDVPEDWTEDQIEFFKNDSSSCADNVLDDMLATADRIGCLCGTLETEFVREATADDELHYQVFVEKLES